MLAAFRQPTVPWVHDNEPGPLVAMLNVKDRHHEACTSLFRRFRGPIIVPAPIVTEVAYFLQIEPGPAVEAAFLEALARGELIVEATTAQDFARMADLVRQYADFPLGTADASVIAVPSAWAPPTSRRSTIGTSGRFAPHIAPPSNYCLHSDPEQPTDIGDRASLAMRGTAGVSSGLTRRGAKSLLAGQRSPCRSSSSVLISGFGPVPVTGCSRAGTYPGFFAGAGAPQPPAWRG
jgi:uncharacterized protein